MRKWLARGVLLTITAAGAACGGDSGVTSPTTPPSPTPAPAPTPAATARYQVTFDAAWSAQSHPRDFPPGPHFSPLVGGTHSSRVSFWQPGGIASDGIEAMAERGNPSLLADEVRAAVGGGRAEFVLRGDGLAFSPGRVGLEFQITRDFPLVTLVSMVAPSPDWFVGVHDLPLIEAGDWVEERVVTLLPYDAGTDSGVTYLSPDENTRPREPIRAIDGLPFRSGGGVAPMGTFTFRRLS